MRVRIEFLTCVRQTSFAPSDGEGMVFSNESGSIRWVKQVGFLPGLGM